MELICIDLEASGLSEESYPIEIAWKNDLTGESDSFLINPYSANDWSHWDEYAEEVHCIDRQELKQNGIDIATACSRLNERLYGKTLISDAYQLDFFWLRKLFNSCNVIPTFEIAGLDWILNNDEREQYGLVAKTQWKIHRALEDVENMIECIRAVKMAV